MISAERVRQLQKAGYIPRATRGKVSLVGAVQGYLRFRNDEERRTSRTAADTRVKALRAEQIALEIAREEGSLIDLLEHQAILEEVTAAFREGVAALPARISRDPKKREIEADIEAVFNVISDKLAQAAEQLEPRGSPVAADAEDDA